MTRRICILLQKQRTALSQLPARGGFHAIFDRIPSQRDGGGLRNCDNFVIIFKPDSAPIRPRPFNIVVDSCPENDDTVTALDSGFVTIDIAKCSRSDDPLGFAIGFQIAALAQGIYLLMRGPSLKRSVRVMASQSEKLRRALYSIAVISSSSFPKLTKSPTALPIRSAATGET